MTSLGGIVAAWVDALNARDLDGMLSVMSEDVEFHPLRLAGVGARYSGHDAVRRWFAQLQKRPDPHLIALADVRVLDGGRLFATGSLVLAPGNRSVGPFCGLHSLEGGLIISAHHYLTDPAMVEQLGLLR